ncbi:MAG TPA: Gfo/Idh/MocA family oxidoreductase, partial [Sedimentisphaerales bacterium]|nr:Gfo/Idh/MocA family oxidoreductase [Sedimentisphaerales bacterium]
MNRRVFIKKSAAGFVLPYLIGSCALASKSGVLANDRINLGFIGVGKQAAGTLIGAFLNESKAQIVAICDVDENKKRDTKKRIEDFYAGKADRTSFKCCDVYHDFRELLARADIDAVVIATPDHWHAIPTVEAARAGKDIYCEKPISLTIDEGKKMVEAVRRYDRVFQTGSMQRSWRQFRFAVELVRNGCIGKVHHVNVNVGGPSGVCNLPAEPVPDYLDWDRWLGPAPWRPFNRSLAYSDEQWGWPNFRSYRDFAGGGMTDFGAHHFD